MRCVNLSAVALNADTISAASKERQDLFNSMRLGVSIVLVSPEQLTSKGFERLVDDPDSVFTRRVCLLAVDEAHLMNTWGQSFRQAFQEIGAMRAHFPGRLPLAAVTATLQDGAPMQSVCSFLGLQPGHYHFIRRSNSRPDIRLIFRTMKSGLSSTTFPELHWVVKNKERCRILIFARTISLGFRIMVDFLVMIPHVPNEFDSSMLSMTSPTMIKPLCFGKAMILMLRSLLQQVSYLLASMHPHLMMSLSMVSLRIVMNLSRTMVACDS